MIVYSSAILVNDATGSQKTPLLSPLIKSMVARFANIMKGNVTFIELFINEGNAADGRLLVGKNKGRYSLVDHNTPRSENEIPMPIL